MLKDTISLMLSDLLELQKDYEDYNILDSKIPIKVGNTKYMVKDLLKHDDQRNEFNKRIQQWLEA